LNLTYLFQKDEERILVERMEKFRKEEEVRSLNEVEFSLSRLSEKFDFFIQLLEGRKSSNEKRSVDGLKAEAMNEEYQLHLLRYELMKFLELEVRKRNLYE